MPLENLIRLTSPGRRRRSLCLAGQGAMVRGAPVEIEAASNVAVFPTLQAAVLRACLAPTGEKIRVLPEDLRRKLLERKSAYSVVFVVDASSSMRGRGRMALAKGLVRAYLKEGRLRRDRVGLVAFRHNTCRLVLPMTSNVRRAERELEILPVGGKTPLAEGMALGLRTLLQERYRDPEADGIMVVVSDGKPNWSFCGGDPLEETLFVAGRIAGSRTAFVFIDTEDDPLAFGYGPYVTRAARGVYRTMTSLLKRKG